jgi:peptidoglycan/LPS O-acetylase OafA/YrhL
MLNGGGVAPESKTIFTQLFFIISRFGHEAVLAFFILSGFLVGGQVIIRSEAHTFSLKTYIIDRTTRIFLPLFPAVLLAYSVSYILGHSPSWLEAIGNMVGANGLLVDTLKYNSPLWSISYEIWFYVVAGVLGLLFKKKSLAPILVFSICLYVFTVHNAILLLVWCFGAIMIYARNAKLKGILAIAGIFIFLFGSLCWQLGQESKSLINFKIISQGVSELMIAEGIALTLPWLSGTRAELLLRVVSKPAAIISAISYTLYLNHYTVFYAFSSTFGRMASIDLWSIKLITAQIATVAIVTVVMWFLFERQTKTLRRLLQD